MRWAIRILAAWVAFSAAQAAELHVAQSAAAGDGNTGSAAEPLRTIAAALDRAKPGDSVVVHEGVYREEAVWLRDDWSSLTARCTLTAAPGERVIMKGSEVVPGPWEPVDVDLTDPGAAEAKVYACPWDPTSQMVFVDEEPLLQIGPQGSRARAKGTNGFQWQRETIGKGLSDLRPGSFYYDTDAKRLYVWLADGGDPSACMVEASVRECALTLQGTWTVAGIEVRHYQDGFWPKEQAVAVAGNSVIVEDCRITHNEFVGLIVSGQDGIIRNNEVAHNGLMGMTSNYGHRMRVEGNDVHHNAWRGDVKCGTCGNKWVTWRDSAFIGNHFHDEPASALWLDISDANILIAENLFEDCDVGVYFKISRWAVIVNNVVRRCTRGIWIYSSDVLVAHNVIDSCGEGITVSSYPRTCSVMQHTKEARQPDALMAVRNNLIVDNILVDCPGAYVGIMEPDTFGWGNLSDYNVIAWTLPAVHETGMHINFMSSWDRLYGKLPIWRMERHCDEHSTLADAALLKAVREGSPWVGVAESQIVDDVGFVDRAGGDYRLRPDSKLIGRGVRIPAELNAPYSPGAGEEIVSRAFAPTAMEARPSPDTPSVYGGETGHYRLQPMPPTRALMDLAAAEPDTPGLKTEWRETGGYPRFAAGIEAVPAADAYQVGQHGLTKDGSFDLPQATGEPDTGQSPWAFAGGMHVYGGMACSNISAGPATTQTATQRVGTPRAGARYVLYCEMMVDSAGSGQAVAAEVRLTAGAALRPVGDAILVRAEPGKASGWMGYTVEIAPDIVAAAAQPGEDLYVVLIARTKGNGTPSRDAIAFARFDHVILLGPGG